MRFIFVKKEQICYYCGSILSPGEEAVILWLISSNGIKYPRLFHTNKCYERWNYDSYVRRLLAWRLSRNRPKGKLRLKAKLGRPRKYSNSIQARRLIGLIYHYNKTGNEAKVIELETKLKELEIGT